ncbi:MAG TPA: lysophospholipid acyltransferase family protein [Micropepsaceae bacterium]|nr:lysophospholipid acyltransferase family protein [Micropepsaceae bacterium]
MIFIRSFLFTVWFALLSVVLNLAWLPAFLLPRRFTVVGVRLWAQGTLWGLRVFAGMTLEVRGRENMQSGACLYASKHFAMWETVVMNAILTDPATVLKKELMLIPFYGWYVWKSGNIAIDRGAHAKAIRRLIARAKTVVAEKRPILIFPEGTRSRPGQAPDYKPGVAALYSQLDIACVPVALNSGLYWPRKGFTRRPGKVIVEFLEPIPPGLKRAEFMSTLETRIETATDRLLAEAGFRKN